jgi:hypothetical protein
MLALLKLSSIWLLLVAVVVLLLLKLELAEAVVEQAVY